MLKLIVVALTLVAGCGDDADVDAGTDATSTDGRVPTDTATGTDARDAGSDTANTDTSGPDTVVTDAGGEDAEPPEGCFDYRTFTATDVSYQDDVMPIFARRCSGCHDDPSGTYYGMGGTTREEAMVVREKLLTATPVQAPDLAFVVPGDPTRSYMMAKVEYENPGGTCAAVVCSAPGCDLFAPPAGMLPEDELAVLRSWVINGALDN